MAAPLAPVAAHVGLQASHEQGASFPASLHLSSSSSSSSSPAPGGQFHPTPSSSPLPALSSDAQKMLEQLRKRMHSILSAEDELKKTFEVMSGDYPDATLMRFLKAREFDSVKAEKMLVDCLRWRVKNDIDNILSMPLVEEKFQKVRASQQYGMTGYDKEGRPVLCVRVGLSYMDPACKLEEYVRSHIQHNEYRDRVLLREASRRKGVPVTASVKIYDMSGLKLAHLGRMQMHRAVAAIDDLNYPEKSEVYYVVNAPSVFGACWKAVRPLLQDRTRKKVKVLEGNGVEELLQDMDDSVLPHFVKYAPRDGLGSSKNLLALATHPAMADPTLDCCSPSHPYHAAVQRYMLDLKAAAANGTAKGGSEREVIGVEEGTGSTRRGEEQDFGVVLEETLSQVNVG